MDIVYFQNKRKYQNINFSVDEFLLLTATAWEAKYTPMKTIIVRHVSFKIL